jgi:serine phosphatase RsbU (regulator of sigma subunit)
MAIKKEDHIAEIVSIQDAVIRSETLRTRCVIIVLGFLFLIGIYRIINPVLNSITAGVLLLCLSLAMILFELFMLKVLNRCKGQQASCHDDSFRNAQLILECLFPVFAMLTLIVFTAIDPYLLLVSPAYALIMIILAASVLRLDVKSTIVCGILSTVSYALFLFYVVNYAGLEFERPYPLPMYFNLVIMLLIASLVAVFVTQQMRHYLESALEEVELKRKHELLQRDLDIAEEIQQSLLPESISNIKGYELAGFSRAAEKAGGDYYDWRLIDDSRLILSLADVTGHGIGPALVTAACRAYVRAILEGSEEIEPLINKLNALLHEDMPSGKFVTFGLLDLNLKKHVVTFLSAGHAPHLFIKGDSGKVEYIEAQGIPLGIVDQQQLDEAIMHKLDTNDLLVMFSDGVYEVTDKGGNQLGLDHFVDLLVEKRSMHASALMNAIEEALLEFLDGSSPSDDMTMVILKRT